MREAIKQAWGDAWAFKSRVSKESFRQLLASIPRTPANCLTAAILVIGSVLTLFRFTLGLDFVTNLDDNTPWGIWNPFKIAGVALSAAGYTASAAYYIFGLKRYKPIVRPALTCAFLGYLIAMVGTLHYDVGQPWRLVFPIFLSQGTTSLLFEVGICVFLYLCVLFVEWTPAAFERFGWKKFRDIVHGLVIPLTIMGIVLSTMHQSSLGALILTSPGKLHPLWYSSFIPVFFFISSIFAGFSMVIVEGTLSKRYQAHTADEAYLNCQDDVALGFGKGAALVMMGYFCIRVFDLAMNNNWHHLSTGYGTLYLLEVIGFVLIPAFLYAVGVREKNPRIIRIAAFMAVAGIVLNRFNVYLFALNWQLPPEDAYFPSVMELGILIFIFTLIITTYRVMCAQLPILRAHPGDANDH
ncbi:MAG: putative Ni/Fe-hydrogenase 2 b-type cytochrome subunit [Desulfovibrio sp.]